MTDSQQVDISLSVASFTNNSEVRKDAQKADKALVASLEQLETLLEATISSKGSKEAKGKNGNSNVMKGVMQRFSPLVSKYLVEDPAKAKEVVSSLSSEILAYAESSESAKNEVANTLHRIISKYLKANPQKIDTILNVFSPLFAEATGNKTQRTLATSTADFAEAFKNLSESEKADVQKTLTESRTNSNYLVAKLSTSLEALHHSGHPVDQKMLDGLTQILIKAISGGAESAENFAKRMLNQQTLQALTNLPDTVRASIFSLIKDGMDNPTEENLASVKGKIKSALSKEEKGKELTSSIHGLLGGAKKELGSTQTKEQSDLMGLAMYYLSLFQQKTQKFQYTQSQIQAEIGTKMVGSAKKAQQDLDNKINQEIAKIQASKHRSIWDIIVGAVLGVVGAIATFFTGGAAAALVFAAVTAFMQSPLFKKAADGLASALGCSKIVANLILTVAVGIASAGVAAGAGSFAETAEEVGTDVTEKTASSMAEEGADEGVADGLGSINSDASSAVDDEVDSGIDEAVSKSEKVAKKAMSKGMKQILFGVMQAITVLIGSGTPMEVGEKLFGKNGGAVAFGATVDLIGMAASMKMGASVMGGSLVRGVGSGLEKYAGYIMKGSLFAQAAGGLSNGVSSALQANTYFELADITREMATDDTTMQQMFMILGINQQSTKSLSEQESSTQKQISSEMGSLDRSAGSQWDATSQVLSA